MKIELRLPTQEQYAYIGIDLLDNEILTDEVIHEALSAYNRAMGQIKSVSSLPTKDFNKFIDNMLLGESNHVSHYEQMSPKQIEVVQEIKKALKRIKK